MFTKKFHEKTTNHDLFKIAQKRFLISLDHLNGLYESHFLTF